MIASSGRGLALLRAEFPDIPFLKFPSYRVRYPTKNMIVNMAVRLPGLAWAIRREHYQLRKAIRDYNLRGVISDHRYGCFSRQVPTVFITHQLHLKIPGTVLSRPANAIHQRLVRQFDACWVPDEAVTPGLAGTLSHPPLKMPTEYVGFLSRLSEQSATPLKYDLLFLLSGPEPQRSRLEQRLMVEARGLNKKILLVQGKTDSGRVRSKEGSVEIVSYLTSGELNKAMAQSRLIVCRSGYSSLMDLVRLGKPAVLIPTPGQTEQEYLAEKLYREGICFYQTQDGVNLREALSRTHEFKGFSRGAPRASLLEDAVMRFLENCGR